MTSAETLHFQAEQLGRTMRWSWNAAEVWGFFGGPVDYASILLLQEALVELVAKEEFPEVILILEHPLTWTVGRGLQKSLSMDLTRAAAEQSVASRIDFMAAPSSAISVSRGGGVTCHEPGQLVIYPIVKLGKHAGLFPVRDVHRWIRLLEQSICQFVQAFDLVPETRQATTGVWVQGKKIASIGVALRRFVSFHGLSINIMNDLVGFRDIHPCGFSSAEMASLAAMKDPSLSSWPTLPALAGLWLDAFAKARLISLQDS